MEFQIRRASEADAVAIAELTAELGYPGEVQAIQNRLAHLRDRADQCVLVAEKETVVCGWLQAHSSEALESGFRVEIVGLIVSVKSRRLGIGRALIEHAERWAASLGVSQVLVRSNTQRVESQSFYPALGYAVAKTQFVYRKRITPSLP
jgi:GNAT superfamily N-acetyltransferase